MFNTIQFSLCCRFAMTSIIGEGIQVDALPDDLLESIQVIVSNENIKKEPADDVYVTVDQSNEEGQFFVIEEYEQAPEAIVHPSIGTTQKDFLKRLSSAGQCFLCTNQDIPGRLRLHFISRHLKFGVTIEDKLIILCNLGCKRAPHYHCPFPDCLFSCSKKNNLKKHYFEHGTDVANELGEPAMISGEDIDGFHVKQ